MSWDKKYDHLKPYKQVICINTTDCRLLKSGFRGVIKETDTKYLIQFNSGAANWYARSRFIDKPEPKQVKVPQQVQETLNKLF